MNQLCLHPEPALAIMEPQDQGDFGGWGERVEIFQHTR